MYAFAIHTIKLQHCYLIVLLKEKDLLRHGMFYTVAATVYTSTHGLTFTWWGCYSLCLT